MKAIPTPPNPDKVILVHNGALGDFLATWPSAWALSRAFPGAKVCFAGPTERLRWLKPLGYDLCPLMARKALDRVFGAAMWPEELSDWLVVWAVVDRIPDLPQSDECRFIRAVPGGTAHVRAAYASDLARLGVATPPGWPDEFRRLFAAKRNPGNTVLLFPGAGHPAKQWPLVQFFQLAKILEQQGFSALFVLGPAEIERGVIPEGKAWVAPESLEDLENVILAARAVVGADTGPMHLAGMLGVPGVSLFGPTSFAKWGPVGLSEVNLHLPCSPCTTTCSDLACPDPRCMKGISPERVLEKLKGELEKCKTGFQGPGFLESRF